MNLKIALIGLGTMGGGMAHHLLSNKCSLAVYNRRREVAEPFAAEGARVATSPREAAEGADIIISMVADDAASRSIWLGESGALAGAPKDAVLIEASTLSPKWIEELAEAASNKGCSLLDAPVTGTKPHAASGQLLFLVGGDADVLARAQPVLDLLGRRTVHLGPLGSGAKMKLINNFLCGVQATALAEALSLGDRCGLPMEAVIDVLTNGAPGSPMVKTMSQRMSDRFYGPNFVLRLMAKDMSYAINLGNEQHLPLRTAQAALELLDQAKGTEWAEKDFSAVFETIRGK